MDSNSNEIIRPFEESLYYEGIESLSVDFAELSLDVLTSMVFEEVTGVLKEMPIIKSAVSIGKFGWSIKKAISMRNQLEFIKSLKQGNPNAKAVERRREAIKNHEKWVEREIETSLVFLDRYTNAQKARYQARLYKDLLNDTIDFEEYEECLTILDGLFICDIEHFLDVVTLIANNQSELEKEETRESFKDQFNQVKCKRLESLGLLRGNITTRMGTSTVDTYSLTMEGIYIYSILRDEADNKHVIIRFT